MIDKNIEMNKDILGYLNLMTILEQDESNPVTQIEKMYPGVLMHFYETYYSGNTDEKTKNHFITYLNNAAAILRIIRCIPEANVELFRTFETINFCLNNGVDEITIQKWINNKKYLLELLGDFRNGLIQDYIKSKDEKYLNVIDNAYLLVLVTRSVTEEFRYQEIIDLSSSPLIEKMGHLNQFVNRYGMHFDTRYIFGTKLDSLAALEKYVDDLNYGIGMLGKASLLPTYPEPQELPTEVMDNILKFTDRNMAKRIMMTQKDSNVSSKSFRVISEGYTQILSKSNLKNSKIGL